MNHRNHRWSILSTITLTLLGVPVLAQGAAAPLSAANAELQYESSIVKPKFTMQASPSGDKAALRAPISSFRPVSLIVKFKSAPLSTYEGGVADLKATAPKATGDKKVDLYSSASQDYLKHLNAEHESFLANARAQIRDLKVINRYDIIFNGMSVIVDRNDAKKLLTLPEVKAVYEDKLVQHDTNISPGFMGAPHIWELMGGAENAGEGVIIGIIDTGVWPEHPSLSDPDPSGKSYPPPPAKWTGTQCLFGSTVPGDQPFTCNNKLIGASRFMAAYDALVGLLPTEFPTARDDDGHGTHTGTTAGGNHQVLATLLEGQQYEISGVAPRAHLSYYKGLGEQGGFTSDLVAAIQQAVADGVDVINYSISGGEEPYSEPTELAFLDAYAAGVFVAASAGNSGPGPDTVAHRGPWVTTIGASLDNRLFLSTITLTADNGDTIQLVGTTITRGISTPTNVVFPPAGNEYCANEFEPGTFNGEICLCRNSTSPTRSWKSYNVLQGGAAGMFIYNQTGLATDNDFLPTVNLTEAAGADLLDFMSTHTGVIASFTDGTPTTVKGDVMANFSSRGGTGQTLEVSKPDVTAPGVNIIAGNTPMPATPSNGVSGLLFQCIQGTSMSSPHAAGAGALLKSLHPDWTPGQIHSALMTTAKTSQVYKQDGTTPADVFDFGSGRVDLNKASDPGITFDIPAQDFVDHAGDLKNVNYPSLYVPVMPGKVTVKRTLKSLLDFPTIWLLDVESPADLKVTVPRFLMTGAGAEKTFEISLDASALALEEVRYATLRLRTIGHEAHFPITIIRRQPVVTLANACDPAEVQKGAETNCTITIQNNAFTPADVDLKDHLPRSLRLVEGSVSGGEASCNGVTFAGTLAAAAPPIVTASVTPGSSPAGYFPIADFGPIDIGATDESITNFNVPTFTYAGVQYSKIGIVSDGYIVVGGGTNDDIQALNANMPAPAKPNNVLAPFWTDLDPAAGGRVLITVLTDGVNDWTVVEWEAVPNYADGELNAFQIWILAGDTEGINFTYGDTLSDGDGSLLTVGAENVYGNTGNALYYNGSGTLPTPTNSTGYEVLVTSVPGAPGESHVVTFRAKGDRVGNWTNCAEMTSNIFEGVNAACFNGKVVK